jgi:hypothetical protein
MTFLFSRRWLVGGWIACLFAVLALSQPRWSNAQDSDGFKPIFDGKSLKDWDGAEGYWSVEDQAITGQFTAENNLPNNTFLIWRGGKVGNFHLKLKFRLTAGNSGIQYRSQEHENFVVGGYQADMDHGKQWVGILYDERGRGILATRMNQVTIQANGEKVEAKLAGDAEQFLEKYRPEEWNTYEIIANGNRLEHIVNGITTIKVDDQQSDASEAEGILAFQLHSGPPMKVQFKDVQLKSLDK